MTQGDKDAKDEKAWLASLVGVCSLWIWEALREKTALRKFSVCWEMIYDTNRSFTPHQVFWGVIRSSGLD